jgi:hypothetical protein
MNKNIQPHPQLKKMKTQTLLFIVAIAVCVSSCKKNNTEPEGIKALFDNTIWTGEAKYASRPIAEPFSIRFDAAGNFIWHEFNGKYPGTFTIDESKKTATMLFNSGATATGAITDDKKLTNFKYGAAYPWTINNMELNNTAESDLNGTVWSGNYVISGTTIGSVSTANLTLAFDSPNMLYRGLGGPYSQSGSTRYEFQDGAIKFTLPISYPFFGVINKGEIVGIQTASGGDFYRWKVTKQ